MRLLSLLCLLALAAVSATCKKPTPHNAPPPPVTVVSGDGQPVAVSFPVPTVSGPMTCTPAPDSLFPVGVTTVNCGLISSASFTVTVTYTPPPPALAQAANLVYEGAFRVPTIGATDAAGFAYGGSAMGFNPARSSIYMVGFDPAQKTAEISIPAVRTGGLTTLATATLLQPLVDVTEGRLAQINPSDPNAKKTGTVLPYGSDLIITGWSYYDGGGTQQLSHFVSGQNMAITDDIQGPFQVGAPVQGHNSAGFVSGYMGLVPSVWQAALGGPVVTGQCCIGIIGRSSSGPALFGIDPAQLGTTRPLPATPLVYYDINHLTLGGQYTQGTAFNGDAEVRGVVVPSAYRSVLFFGRLAPNYCYGAGTPDKTLDGQPYPGVPGLVWCYDPEDNSKGSHSWPKAYTVWAYDINDLAEVKDGKKLPWQIVPYAVWSLPIPYTHWSTHIFGAAFDPATQRIYLSQGFGDGSKPVIHVYVVR